VKKRDGTKTVNQAKAKPGKEKTRRRG